ncbi:MAG: glycine zipper 2TM domain-containing protein [Caulobacteraceae bacterium]|nr:glycine zipper 2TM domain-containing protein [Caulobacteraceae bacterium]
MRAMARGAGLAVAVLATAATVSGPVQAQPYPAQPPGYAPGYAYGDTNVAPPEGYDARSGRYDASPAARAEDERYARAAERWAMESCVDQRENNRAAGAVIGGVLGAILGSSVAGRHDRGAGAVVGGMAGAIAGSAIGASSTSPGCPPGYVVRSGAPPFSPPMFGGGFVYVAPPGYRPWIWSDGRWGYRPYPYHRYWYGYERRHGWDHR